MISSDLLGDPLDRVVMAIARPPRPIRARHDELRSFAADAKRGAYASATAALAWPAASAASTTSSMAPCTTSRSDRADSPPACRAPAATASTSRFCCRRRPTCRPRSSAYSRPAPPNGADPRLAIQRAILSGGPGLFPSAAQIHSECTCPDGPRCKHVVAAVHAFGVLLDREPEQLLVAVGPRREGVRWPRPGSCSPPLAADRRPLVDDLAIFGIDLLDPCEPATGAPAPAPVAATEPALEPQATSRYPRPGACAIVAGRRACERRHRTSSRRSGATIFGSSVSRAHHRRLAAKRRAPQDRPRWRLRAHARGEPQDRGLPGPVRAQEVRVGGVVTCE
jgi:hypothetical protein